MNDCGITNIITNCYNLIYTTKNMNVMFSCHEILTHILSEFHNTKLKNPEHQI